MYKSKLNEFCQKNGWRNPKYSCIKDGQEHTPLFKASVLVNGETFTSLSVFKSSKSAHNDVASLALSHFTTSSRELSKNIELCLPVLPEEKAMATASLPSETTLSINKETNSKKFKESYLICNKVRVHTSIPTTVLPNGTVMLPIGEDKWTVVSLESV
ncbi:unnamed protein product [Lactuca saligna]|uniref:DRBM domain-containing protein n=1 Tax=Lactuca saligna TaxID=75948 RepID=A0AA36DZJ3_LACSI|nr:unnamed protein product [Lactuca saligna]